MEDRSKPRIKTDSSSGSPGRRCSNRHSQHLTPIAETACFSFPLVADDHFQIFIVSRSML